MRSALEARDAPRARGDEPPDRGRQPPARAPGDPFGRRTGPAPRLDIVPAMAAAVGIPGAGIRSLGPPGSVQWDRVERGQGEILVWSRPGPAGLDNAIVPAGRAASKPAQARSARQAGWSRP